jgi:hypothetical protein
MKSERTWSVGEIIELRDFGVCEVAAIVLDRESGRPIRVAFEDVRGRRHVKRLQDIQVRRESSQEVASLFRALRSEIIAASSSRACAALDCWASLLSRRVANEDLGDYRERVERNVRDGRRCAAWGSVLSAMFWTLFNGIEYSLKYGNGRTHVAERMSNSMPPLEPQMRERVVVIPVTCKKCRAEFDMECRHSSGFAYMQPVSFRCTSCGHGNDLGPVPSDPLRIIPRR